MSQHSAHSQHGPLQTDRAYDTDILERIVQCWILTLSRPFIHPPALPYRANRIFVAPVRQCTLRQAGRRLDTACGQIASTVNG